MKRLSDPGGIIDFKTARRRRAGVTFDDIADSPVWLGWRSEDGTKVPYSADGGKGSATNPDTWRPRAQCERWAAKQQRYGRVAGVGVVLGPEIGDGRVIIGVDLDSCRSPDGVLAEWAQDVVERFASYGEASPSQVGVKLFGVLGKGDLPLVVALLGGSLGRSWKRAASGAAKAAGIEFYTGGRYFTVTGEQLPNCPGEIQPIDVETVKWLVHEAGPRFAEDGKTAGKGKGRDDTRSGDADRLARSMQRAGKSYEDYVTALQADPQLAEWYREKGQRYDEREAKKTWNRWAGGIDPKAAPYRAAQQLLEQQFDEDGARTLHHHRGGFYAWNGRAYRPLEALALRALLYRFVADCTVKDAKTGVELPVDPNKQIVGNLEDALIAVSHLDGALAAPAWLDGRSEPPAGELVACGNGLLHLPKRGLLPHSPAYFTPNAVEFDYEPDAVCPLWDEFLRQLWGDDAEAIETLQEIFGYCLSADTRQHKMFLLVGPTRSGKGTIARTLATLLGRENCVSPTLAQLGVQFGLEPLIDKRAAIIADARLGGRADQQAIGERLLSVSDEDLVTIDRKHKLAWTGQLKVRFVVMCNELPRLADVSGALAGQFIVLLLTQSFYGKEDLGLTEKLLTELPGILNWTIAGWQRLTRRGWFRQPQSANDAVRELEELASPIKAFLRERCTTGMLCSVGKDELYAAWCEWCTEQGRDYPGTKATFARDLLAAIPWLKPVRLGRDGDRRQSFQGVALN